MMRLILTGATGVAGLNIYRAALADPAVTAITLVQRREMPSWAALPSNASEKTTTIIQNDFASYSPEVASQLAQHDACIWAQGKSVLGMSEGDYTKLTHDYPLAMAKALRDAGATQGRKEDQPFRFVYVSGEHADKDSSRMWARVKGTTEMDLAIFCNESTGMKAHSMRPAYFPPSTKYPNDAMNQRGRAEAYLNRIATPIFSTFIPSLFTPVEELGAVAVEIAKGRWPTVDLFRNTMMRELAKEL